MRLFHLISPSEAFFQPQEESFIYFCNFWSENFLQESDPLFLSPNPSGPCTMISPSFTSLGCIKMNTSPCIFPELPF